VSFANSSFGVPKKQNRILSGYTKRTDDLINKAPIQLSATRQPIQLQSTAPSQNQAIAPTSTGASPQYESTVLPDSNPDTDYQGNGTEGILDIGRNATREEETKLANRVKLSNQNLDSGLATNISNGDFSGSGAGSGVDADALNNARVIANVGRQMGIDDNGIRIAIMTSLAESGLKNVNYGDRDSLGLFQQRPSQGWGTPQQVLNPQYAASKFFQQYKNGTQGDPWAIAQGIQKSAFADGSNYAKQWNLANSVFNSIYSPQQQGVTQPNLKPNGSLSWINANNNKYHDFDGRYGAQCVDLFNFYASGFVGANLMMGQAPNARDLWTVHDPKAFAQVGNNQIARMGDAAVWGGTSNHVAIVVGDNGNGTLKVLTANSTSLGSRGNTVIMNLSKSNLLGYLRPRKLL